MRIEPSNCFYKLKNESTVLVDHCEKLLNTHQFWAPYIGWDVILIDREIYMQEEALKIIDSKFPINRAAILKADPYQMYDWHKDEYRGVCINMSLTPEWPSHCLFGTDKNYTNKYFHELKYQPKSFYVFNNQVDHCVINFDQPRYMFSLEFVDHLDNLNYKQVKDWAVSSNA
tara:strand:+ start:252 stop:767 length:516 start_codon:yes stop_codon:yes gene_type:complete